MTESLSTVVRMPLSTFVSWISDGICRFPLTEFVPSDEDVFVQLLPKYFAQLSAGRQVTALVDEVVAVTQLTATSTKELGIRLHNLNESWLPVHYFPLALPIASSNMPSSGTVVEAGHTRASNTVPLVQEDIASPAVVSQPSPKTKSQSRRGSNAKSKKPSIADTSDVSQTLLFNATEAKE